MVSWNKLIKSHSNRNKILVKLTQKRYKEHVQDRINGYQKCKPIKIDKELLDYKSTEKDSYIFTDTNYHTGNLKSDVYEKSLLQKTNYGNDHPVTQKLNKHFGKTFGWSNRNIQQPGQVVLHGSWNDCR